MKNICCLLSVAFILSTLNSNAQNVGIGTNTPHISAKLEVADTAKGMLIPRIDSLHRVSISNPATGLLVYETNSASFWYFNGNAWVKISNTGSSSAIMDADGNTSVTTEKNNNEDIIRFSIAGNEQWKMQQARLEPSNTSQSIFIGKAAGLADDLINAKYNISIGDSALLSIKTGSKNIAIGSKALYKNTTGHHLIAIGDSALFDQSNDPIDIYGNTAIGTSAMRYNTTGYNNTATGQEALYKNTIGVFNVATGRQSLYNNIDGLDNTASGNQSLFSNISGSANAAFGDWSARFNTTGNFNTAMGASSLYNNIDGGANTATGASSLNNNSSGNYNTAIGYSAGSTNTTGSYNTFLGVNADVSSVNISRSVAIGYNAKVAQNNSVVIGGTGIDAVNVGIGITAPTERLDVAGNIKATGTITPSDKRYKIDIQPLQNSLEKLLLLNAVSYEWDVNKFTDKGFTSAPQIGFIAQEVEKVFPQIVHTGSDGYKGIDYTKLIPVLAAALKEQHTQNELLQKRIEALEKMIPANVIEK